MGEVDKERLIRVVEACGKILGLGLRGLDAIILFGSVARGEEDRRSDTDLLLLFEDEEKALQAEDETAKMAAESSDINLSIVNKGYDEFSRNPYFPFEVLRDGIVLYKKPSVLTLGASILPTKPFYIYILNMKELDKGERNRVNVALYGRTKGKYRYRGLLELVQGMKLGRGAVMIPAGAFRRMEELLSANKVHYRRLAVGYLFGDA